MTTNLQTITITWIFAYFAVFSLKHFWINLFPVYVFFIPLLCIFYRCFIILIQRWKLDVLCLGHTKSAKKPVIWLESSCLLDRCHTFFAGKYLYLVRGTVVTKAQSAIFAGFGGRGWERGKAEASSLALLSKKGVGTEGSIESQQKFDSFWYYA